MKNMVVFSDIDETFIDRDFRVPHSDENIKRWFSEFRIVFVSSRTVEEIFHLQQGIGVRSDFIAESGGVICTYDLNSSRKLRTDQIFEVGGVTLYGKPLAEENSRYLSRLRHLLGQSGRVFRILHEMPAEQIAEMSGFDREDGERARSRRFSVLIDGQEGLNGVVDGLAAEGFQVTFGGRWWTVIKGSDKGKAVEAYLKWLYGDNPPPTAGIGDSEGDLPMLRAVKSAFAVKKADGKIDVSLGSLAGVNICAAAGAAGFAEAMSRLELIVEEIDD